MDKHVVFGDFQGLPNKYLFIYVLIYDAPMTRAHRPEMSKSLYIVDHILYTLILSGLDQSNSPLCQCKEA